MEKSVYYIDCILPVPLNQYFTYRISEKIADKAKVGCRVIVQFGNRKYYTAIILQIHTNKPEYETKETETLLDDEPIVGLHSFSFWEWMAAYYCCPVGDVMNAALPSGLKLESHTSVHINQDWIEYERLSGIEESVFLFLQGQEHATIQQINSLTKKTNAYSIIQSLLKKDAIRIEEKVEEKYQPKLVPYLKISSTLLCENDFNIAFENLKKAKKQLDLMMLLINELHHFSSQPQEMILKKEFMLKGRFSEGTLKSLIDKKYVEVVAVETSRITDKQQITQKLPQLSPTQEEALNLIYQEFISKNVVLLHGVTASGKTEIYIRMIADQLRAGKQVLYLLPEIALTSQIIDRLKAVFGEKAGIYHSKFNDAERVEIWNNVLHFDKDNNTNCQLILGARSSIFLPFENLGLIIVDEENETSYKQFDPSPRYNARDSAVMLGHFHGAKVVMGTATPSFDTFYNVQSGKYGYVHINKRYYDVAQPEIVIADISDAIKRRQMKSLFTPTLLNEISAALKKEEQIIIFQNRRGFSPYIQCRSCGWIPMCKHCDVSLTYHKLQNNLQCHYCGYTVRLPNTCEKCQSTDIQSKGFGTEKIEDELKIFFPDATIERLDHDSTQGKHSHEKILHKFSTGKTNILVGTQMITKGLDFENVSVVGIIDADALLNYPDFRSHERAFQLMLQVSGRAGRKKGRGKVVIQTYQASHPILSHVLTCDFNHLFSSTLHERKLFQYPPFFRLVYITVKHKNRDRAQLASQQLTVELKKLENIAVLGPEYPLLARIQQYYQLMIRIKIRKSQSPVQIKCNILQSIDKVKHYEQNGSVVFAIDVDPL